MSLVARVDTETVYVFQRLDVAMDLTIVVTAQTKRDARNHLVIIVEDASLLDFQSNLC